MERGVAMARLEKAGAHHQARWAMSAALHRLAGLVPPPIVPDSASSDPPAGPYCRLWQRGGGWGLPEEAGAQTPARRPPPPPPLPPPPPPPVAPPLTPRPRVGGGTRGEGGAPRRPAAGGEN